MSAARPTWRVERDTALLRLERESNPERRAEAAETLCGLALEAGEREAVEFAPAVVRLIADPQTEVRVAGLALATAVLPEAEVVPLLTRHLSDSDRRVRVEAAGRLADLAPSDSRGSFAAALQDEAFAVRFEAARGMAALKHPAGLDVLLAALDDADFRFRALSALAELKDPACLPKVRALFSRWLLPPFERTLAAAVLAKLHDPDGARHLFARAAKKWSVDRPMAVELLGEVKAADARPRLEQILADPKDSCRGAAARGLGRLGDAGATAALVRVASEAAADDDLKLDVAEGLWLLDTEEAKAAARAITVEDPDARAELKALLES